MSWNWSTSGGKGDGGGSSGFWLTVMLTLLTIAALFLLTGKAR